MNNRLFTAITMAVAVAVLLAAPVIAAAQRPAPAASAAAGPVGRTPDGHPDMQGIWGAGADADGASHSVEIGPEPANAAIDGSRNRPATTIIISEGSAPRIPYQLAAAVKRQELLSEVYMPQRWSDLEPEDRCLLNGMPRSNYRGNIQVLQTPGMVTMLYEFGHAHRTIPIDGSSHPPSDLRQWNGDSRGHWEGNTLVVDVTNFLVDPNAGKMQPWIDSHGSFYSEALHVVERWTMVDAGTLRFEATIEDPNVFTKPWKLGFNMRRNRQKDFEFFEEACWEGERNTTNMITAGRKAKASGQNIVHTHD